MEEVKELRTVVNENTTTRSRSGQELMKHEMCLMREMFCCKDLSLNLRIDMF